LRRDFITWFEVTLPFVLIVMYYGVALLDDYDACGDGTIIIISMKLK